MESLENKNGTRNGPDSQKRTLKSTKKSDSITFVLTEARDMPWTDSVSLDFVENAVFFAYFIASPIGGILTVNHDSSLLLGCSVATTCGINLFLPLASTMSQNYSYYTKITSLIILRTLQGLAEGCLIPAVFGVIKDHLSIIIMEE